MSTKTLRKRIALVAVSALGAGLLSVVAVPSASATAPVTQRYEANVNANATAGVAGVSSTVLTAGNGTASAGSIGLLGSTGTDSTQTAVLLASGTLSSTLVAYSGESMTASVTGGTFTAVGSTTAGTTSISAPANTSAKDTTVSGYLSTLAKPNSGATSMVVTYSTISNLGVSTLRARITTTIVATSAYNKYAATYSTVYWGDGSTFSATTDSASANSTLAAAGIAKGRIILTDAYGNLLSALNTSLVTVTATGGALVSIGGFVIAGDRETAYTTLGGAIDFNVQQDDTDVPLTSTVTIAVGGTVVATKTLVIKGEVASVTVTSAKIGQKGQASNLGAAKIAYADAAGNALYPTSGTSAVAATLGATVTALSVGTWPTSTVTGLITMGCGSGLQGTVKGLQVSHLNASGTVVKSNAWDSGCADVPYTVTASWDRVSYVPGSIATLTLTFKDSKGNLSSAFDIVGSTDGVATTSVGSSAAADILTVTGAPSTTPVTAIVYTDKPSGVTGAVTYQYVVGTTEGDYVAVINPTEIKGNNSSVTANISLPYTVKSTSTAVTNADVLKAIVSLIASINKQIAALQKALLKK